MNKAKSTKTNRDQEVNHQSSSQYEFQEKFDVIFWRRLGVEILYISSLLKENYEDQEKAAMTVTSEETPTKKT